MVTYSRNNPFYAKVLNNYNLNGSSSSKETRHIELSLKDSGLSYEAGDCLGIYPENDPELVDALISEMSWDGEMLICVNNQSEKVKLKDALTNHYDMTSLNKKIMRTARDLIENQELNELVSDNIRLKEYIEGRDLLDLVRDFDMKGVSVDDFLGMLRKMLPRLYSIASSIKKHDEEVHLTIGAVRYFAHGRNRKGVCSVHCAERICVDDTLPVFIQKNNHFKLPDSGDAPIIMIGPGTGIAPFRSFIEERDERGDSGGNWLFFGERYSDTDFLYEDELNRYLNKGTLTKFNTAFSRDDVEKVYVQHKMLENASELFEWLENGAYFYVCGDKEYMARDVHETLLKIIECEGDMTSEEACRYLDELKKQKRYLRDVY